MFVRGVICLCMGLLLVKANLHKDGAIYRSHPEFSVDLSNLKYQRYIKGGSGGVHIVQAHNSAYTVKFSLEGDHLEEEVIADKLYEVLGVATPKFIVLQNYSQLPSILPATVSGAPIVRVAEFISANEHPPSDVNEAAHLASTYVVDAFMANRDASKHGNSIYNADGVFYRIDNGGSLRNRSKGKRKKGTKRGDLWDGQLIPELKTFIQYSQKLYGNLTDVLIHEQARFVLSRGKDLAIAFKEITSALQLSEEFRSALATVLSGRLKFLEMLLHPGVSFPADVHRPPSSLSGAGVFLICTQHNIAHVLLGNRRSSHESSNNHWSSLGGKVDFDRDASLAHTAQRELFEETTGLLKLDSTFIAEALFHDIVHEDFIFRQYFRRTSSCPNEALLLTVNPPPELKDHHSLGAKEYHLFKWFPVSQVRDTTVSGNISNTGMVAYQPFATILQVPRVQALLRLFETQEKVLPKIKFAQSMPKTLLPIESDYGTFTDFGF